jgi:hypothetical protein
VRRILPVTFLLLAGCLGDPSDQDGRGDAEEDQAIDYEAIEAAIGEPLAGGELAPGSPDHYNLERVAVVTGDRLIPDGPADGYAETAVKDGYAYVCRTGIDQGLVIFDVADIEEPVQVGYLRLNAGFECDIEVSDDGEWAFWETQRAYLGIPPPTPDPMDPAGAGGVAPHGIHVIDISDKTDPTWVSFTPIVPDGPHSITYGNLSGRHLVFASTYSYLYVQALAAPPMMQRLVILELDTSGPTARLVTRSEYIDPDATEESIVQPSGEKFPHDVSFQYHPITGQPLAYVAYWDLGIVLLDVSDPANPVKVGVANDFGPAPYGDIHMGRPFPGLIAGRHVTASEPEISGQQDSGYITFFDTTDPAEPRYISSWLLPGNLSSADTGGPHYFDANFGRIALAHYSAGFWVIDVHNEENLLDPKTVAYAMTESGSAFDAWWADPTHIVAGESGSGLVVFRYTGPTPMPDGQPVAAE